MKWQANRDILASGDMSSLLDNYPFDKGVEDVGLLMRKFTEDLT